MTIRESHEVEPGAIFLLDPFQIEVGPALPDVATEDVAKMAVSLHKHGQRKPVECRKEEDGSLRVLHGSLRTAAARLLRTGFSYREPPSGTEVVIREKHFKLWVIIL